MKVKVTYVWSEGQNLLSDMVPLQHSNKNRSISCSIRLKALLFNHEGDICLVRRAKSTLGHVAAPALEQEEVLGRIGTNESVVVP